MLTFFLVLQAIIAAALVGVILVQKSEGGGLGVGGSPAGLMSARGAADFLTRATTVLAIIFVGLSIALAVFAAQRSGGRIDTTNVRTNAPVQAPTQPVPASPVPMANPNAAPISGAVPAPQPSAPKSQAPVPASQPK